MSLLDRTFDPGVTLSPMVVVRERLAEALAVQGGIEVEEARENVFHEALDLACGLLERDGLDAAVAARDEALRLHVDAQSTSLRDERRLKAAKDRLAKLEDLLSNLPPNATAATIRELYSGSVVRRADVPDPVAVLEATPSFTRSWTDDASLLSSEFGFPSIVGFPRVEVWDRPGIEPFETDPQGPKPVFGPALVDTLEEVVFYARDDVEQGEVELRRLWLEEDLLRVRYRILTDVVRAHRITGKAPTVGVGVAVPEQAPVDPVAGEGLVDMTEPDVYDQAIEEDSDTVDIDRLSNNKFYFINYISDILYDNKSLYLKDAFRIMEKIMAGYEMPYSSYDSLRQALSATYGVKVAELRAEGRAALGAKHRLSR